MKWTRQVVTAYALIFVYAICFKLQAPIEPFLVKKLSAGGDATSLYGKVQSAYNVAQAMGTFVMGPFLDRFGGRMGFILAFSSGACSYGLLAVADNMSMLYLSKVPGAFMHPFMVAQTFMAQQTTGNERAEALALLVTAFTIGGTVGPTLGGWLGASGDYYLGAKVSACGMILNVLLAVMLLGGGGSTESHSKKEDSKEKSSVLVDYRNILMNPAVCIVIFTKLCSSTFNSVYETMYPVILKDNFALKEQEMGYVLSASMLTNAFVSKFAVGPLTARFTGSRFCGYCLACMSWCYFHAPAVMPGSGGSEFLAGLIHIHPSIPFIGLTLLIFAAAFARASAFTGVNTTVVPSDLKGTAISMEHTMFSISRSVTPIFTSWLSAAMGSGAVCFIVAACETVNALSWSFIAIPLVKRAQEKFQELEPELGFTKNE